MTRKPAAGSTYSKLVRTFDHAHLARLPAYQALRQALSDLGNQFNADERPREQPTTLDDFLGAIRDMALTAPTPTAVSTATTATAT